ncbi:hypothetical protein KP001_11970 [Geomonas subterranea]|uniref:Phage protein n=1 Tax=Geomonas subterranea TaxID=2847989 RepID=A0ABX8LFN3_9BACT|nr:hypothetical protein [Geomonas subterranea]QXE89184.1 hypothetical protein KP001_11970 [Geomonas subterranea]QXM08701.1 hypothetical protein KP002_17305 [Geomonas subterranea]
MDNRQYISVLASRIRYNPKTVEEVMILKTQILNEFQEQDMALNEILKRMETEQTEARIKAEHDRQFDEFMARPL